MIYIFYSKVEKNQPRVTVAGFVKDNVLYTAVARCSKKDQFVRKIGRAIATGRLRKHIYYNLIPITDTTEVNKLFVEVAKEAAEDLRATGRNISWPKL